MRWFLLLAWLILRSAMATDGAFSFHLFSEPANLDVATATSSGSYLFQNLFHGLYRYSSAEGLIPEGARRCRAKDLRITCELNSSMKWSDGVPVTSDDYVRAFRRIFDPEVKSTATELLIRLKNAHKILKNEARFEDLGVTAEGPLRLIFEFDSADPEFLYKLTNVALSPLRRLPFPSQNHASQLLVNGPYQIDSWIKGKKIVLKANPFYPRAEPTPPPPVEIFFVDDDSTALTLYENGQLQFLRRVAINDVSALRGRKDFLELPMARFDYIGFGPSLKNQPELRKALSLSLKYSELKMLMQTIGRPGCPALSSKYFADYPCLSYQLSEAKKALAKVSSSVKKQKLTVYFSKMGGDSHQIVFEWVQNQWKKNLGLDVELQSQEQNVVTQTVQSGQAAIFRRGIGLDRPTCLAAIENFQSSAPENFIRFSNPVFDTMIAQWSEFKTERQKRKKCSEAVHLLLKDHWMIPLGVVTFSMLAKPQFKGWTLNELNQLDLSHLKK